MSSTTEYVTTVWWEIQTLMAPTSKVWRTTKFANKSDALEMWNENHQLQQIPKDCKRLLMATTMSVIETEILS